MKCSLRRKNVRISSRIQQHGNKQQFFGFSTLSRCLGRLVALSTLLRQLVCTVHSHNLSCIVGLPCWGYWFCALYTVQCTNSALPQSGLLSTYCLPGCNALNKFYFLHIYTAVLQSYLRSKVGVVYLSTVWCFKQDCGLLYCTNNILHCFPQKVYLAAPPAQVGSLMHGVSEEDGLPCSPTSPGRVPGAWSQWGRWAASSPSSGLSGRRTHLLELPWVPHGGARKGFHESYMEAT